MDTGTFIDRLSADLGEDLGEDMGIQYQSIVRYI
jgi:hypothetical protein